MNRIGWWAAKLLSGTLEPDEREAAYGDVLESTQSGRQALRDLLSLAARRQAVWWTRPRPWLVSLGLVVPLGVLLNLVAIRAAGLTAIYAWLYIDNWTPGYLAAGFRQDLFKGSASFCAWYLALACSAWSCGVLMGWLSRRAAGITGTLFFCVLGAAGFWSGAWDQNPGSPNAAVFALFFYRAILPGVMLMLLVVLPGLGGIGKGPRLAAFSKKLRWMVGICLWATVAGMVCSGLRARLLMPWCAVAAIGPLGYLMASKIWRRGDGRGEGGAAVFGEASL